MKIQFLIFLIAITLVSCQNNLETFKVEKGVSWELAQQRKAQIDQINYKLFFDIPKSKTESIAAGLDLKVNLKHANTPLVLDFNPNNSVRPKVFIDGDTIAYLQKDEHLIIPANLLKKGENNFTITFQAGDLSLNRNDDYLYTLLVPDRARTLFPCFDQPNLKAKYTLQLKTPKAWKVLNATYTKSVSEEGAFKTHTFEESDLMSTYLFSFVAGDFQEITRNKHRFLYREKDSLKIENSLDPIFKKHDEAIAYLENYTNYKFPFEKLDFASIPYFQFGGMEHVGAIQYKEATLFFEDYMPVLTHWNRANLIAHETTHMWFGDLVTMEWFDDVWLKEVFANFIAEKIVNPSFPEINHNLLDLVTKVPSAYSTDRTKGTNAIRQRLDNLKDAGSMYGEIIYKKAPVMMRQLEFLLGEDKFKEGLQEYIKTYANSNATWDDLVAIFDEKSEYDIKKWSDVWVNKTGRAVFTDNIVYKDGIIKSAVLQQHAEDGTDKVWPQNFEVALIYADSISRKTILINEKSKQLIELEGMPKPKAIIYNSNGVGYGVFPIDSITALNNYQIKDEVIRAQNYINTFENALSGNLPVKTVIKAFLRGTESEDNGLIMGIIMRDLSQLFWKYLNNEQRDALQPELTGKIWNRLHQNLPVSVNKILFNTYTGLAYKGESLDNLYKIWNKDLKINNLILNENDYTSLAMSLALYNHPKRNDILEFAETQITNPEDKDRFRFLLPALSNDPKAREALFLSFKDVKNRVKPNWVESANDYIHHSLRQRDAITYLPLSLELLEEIQETSDIFFPKYWLESTIGRYQSKEAKAILDDYLAKKPDLNPQLKAKVLQVTDNLERYQAMISK